MAMAARQCWPAKSELSGASATRASNLAKHGIDFVLAAKIFRNPTIEHIDDRADYGEERLIAVGHWNDEVLVVVYTWRDENRRIISAWRIDDEGKRRYQALFARRP